MTNATTSFATTSDINVGMLTFAEAKSTLTWFMKTIVGKSSKNRRAMTRAHALIVQAKTEVTHSKREVILFDLLEELEVELSRL